MTKEPSETKTSLIHKEGNQRLMMTFIYTVFHLKVQGVEPHKQLPTS